MGACATKPKDLDTKEAPAPVEAPAEVAPQENGAETEAPLVDLSEEPKVEEVAAAAKEAKPAEEAVEAKEEVKNVA